MKIFILLIMSLSLWANIGNIMAMKGSAEVERSGSSVSAEMGMILLEGDAIKTAKKSRIQIMLKDSTIVTIGSNSSFSFDEYQFDGTASSKLTMSTTRGFFRSVTGKIGKLAPQRFKVKTASATIGIRGTDFSGDIRGEREVFRCYEGAIFVEFDGGVNDIDAGMMIEIHQGKYEIREFDAGKLVKSIGKNMDAIKSIARSIDGGEIPTEVISDVTQVVEDVLNEDLDPEDEYDYPPSTPDPLTIDPYSEDRQIQY